MDLKPVVGRPKVGQKVILLRPLRMAYGEPRVYWERGTVEIVRRGVTVVRVGSFERVVPWGDLRVPPVGGLGGPWWKRDRGRR